MATQGFGRKGTDSAEMARRREAFIASERARREQLAQGSADPFERPPAFRDEPALSRPVFIREKSLGVAYLLWFFLGAVAGHRFYLGFTTSAVVQLCLWAVSWMMVMGGFLYAVLGLVVVFIWILADLFLIPSLCRTANEQARRRAQELAFA